MMMAEQSAWPEGGPLAVAAGLEQMPAAGPEEGTQAPAEGVLTKDEQHVIPYDVLEEARRRVADERARADRLQAELDAVQQPPEQAQAQTQAEGAVDKWPEQRNKLANLFQEALADGDRELAAAYEAQLEQGDQIAVLRTGMDELRQTVVQTAAEQQQRQAHAEQQQIEAALATSPLLVAWADDASHPLWHQTAVEIHTALLDDPNSAYARMSWEQRFAALPQMVEERVGVTAPHRRAVSGSVPPVRRAPQVPYSISGIPGAQPVGPGLPSGPGDLGNMSGREQTKYMVGLYSDGRLFNNLRDFPIGALNTGGRHEA